MSGQVHGPGSRPKETYRLLKSQVNRDGCLNCVPPRQLKSREGAPQHQPSRRAGLRRPRPQQPPGWGHLCQHAHCCWEESPGPAGDSLPPATAFLLLVPLWLSPPSLIPLPPSADSWTLQSRHAPRERQINLSPWLTHAHIHPPQGRSFYFWVRGEPLWPWPGPDNSWTNQCLRSPLHPGTGGGSHWSSPAPCTCAFLGGSL